MDKIYQDAKDVHVVGTYVYGKTTNDTYAYVDSGCTTKYKTSELKEAFLKGAVVVVGEKYYKPISFEIASNAGKVTFVKADTTTATTAVLDTLKAVSD